MGDIITVAQSTFERFARLKALYVILAICILDVWTMALYKDLTMGLEQSLMINAALAIITIVGLVTASVAAFEVPRELREKTAQFILTKPMGRSAFVWGKFLGVSLLAVFNIAIVAVGSLLVYYLKYEEVALGIIKAAVLLAGMAVILVGVGLVFSMFLSDTLAAVGVFIVFALGHMLFMWGRTNGLGKALANIFPNFYNLDIKTEVPADVPVDNTFVYWGIAYALLYAIALTGLATMIFSRKDVS